MQTHSDTTLDSFLSDNPLAVVMFGATWCAPCKALKPKVQKLSEEFSAVAFTYCSVDDAPQHASEWGISSIPTLVGFVGGKRSSTLVTNREETVRDMVLALQVSIT